jgi:predicted dienelactone hydrolase
MRRISGAVALGLTILIFGKPARGVPVDVADPAARDVLVRFEVNEGYTVEDLRIPHEGFGEPFRLAFRSDGATASILIPASVVEAELLTPGPLQTGSLVPGGATDALLEIDVATGAVSVRYSFDALALFGQLGPFPIAVDLRSDGVGGYLPSLRFCEAPPRCVFVPGEAYDPSTGLLLAVGPGSAEGVGSALFVFDAELSEVPEPGTGSLLLAGLMVLARSARRRRTAIVAAVSALGVACGAPIEIASPAPGTVLMAPDVDVSLAFDPPLAAGESIDATLQRGIDSPAGSAPPADMTGALALGSDSATAILVLTDLAPGRNELIVERFATGGGVSLGSRTLTLDRGGFPGAEAGPFGAGARYEQVTRTTATGARVLDVAIWYPTADAAASPETGIELELRAALDPPLLPGARSLPLILYSHGSCGWEGEVGYLAGDLARAGYVVAATSHPGNTSLDVEPPCNRSAISTADRARDVRAMLDALLAWNGDASWPLAGAIDPSRIGVAGFSAGGATAWLLTAGGATGDRRIRAALQMANAFAFPTAVPNLLMGGTLDPFVPVDSIQSVFDGLSPPRFFVVIDGANHRSFANDCLEAFYDCVSGVGDRSAIQSLIRGYARGFFHRFVADDVRGDALLVSVLGADLQEER